MPRALDALWETIIHAPSLAFEPVAEALGRALADESERAGALLTWLGHGGGACPVCRMLVGPLVFTLAEPTQVLGEVLEGAPSDLLLDGAGLFLASLSQPRHARAAGVSDERLGELRRQTESLPAAVKRRLLTRWEEAGRAPGGLDL